MPQSLSCPSTGHVYAGGATAAGGAEEIRIAHRATGYDIHGVDQPTISGLEGIACVSVHSCEASGDQDLPHVRAITRLAGAPQGLRDRYAARVVGTAADVRSRPVNPAGYLAVGYTGGADWVADLVSATGQASPIDSIDDGGYLQA